MDILSDRKTKDINKDDFKEVVQDFGIRVNADRKEIKACLKEKGSGKKLFSQLITVFHNWHRL